MNTDNKNASLHVSERGLSLIMRYEGFRATAYTDSAGYPTIGFGHKLVAGEQYDSPISTIQAEALLRSDAAQAEQGIQSLVTISLTQLQYDALVSFVYNVGVAAFAGSLLLKLLNAGDIQQAGDDMLQWDKIHIGGVVTESPGLIARRAAERAIFLEE